MVRSATQGQPPGQAGAGQAGAGQAGAALSLRLLATTDLHMALLPWDYAAGRADMGQGLALTAALIAEARAEVANSLLFDNGDFLQGNALGDYLARPDLKEAAAQGRRPATHPMIAAMNRLGYDAGALGNHEFSHGLDHLRDALSGARFPFLSANLHSDSGHPPLVPGAALLRRRLRARDGRGHVLRIGVFGLTPPQTLQWEAHAIGPGLWAEPALAAARRAVADLRAARADVIIALCHSGLSPETGPIDENFATDIAGVEGVDAVIAGHEHLLFPNPKAPDRQLVAGKPVVMAGCSGSHLGVIDLDLIRARGRWHVTAARAHLRAVADRAGANGAGANGAGANGAGANGAGLVPDGRVSRLAARDHRATLAWMRRTIGHSPAAISTTFALASPVRALELIAQAQTAYVRAALSGTEAADLPLLSAVAPFRAGGRGGPENFSQLPKGRLTLRDAANLYPHPNLICALRLTGAEVAEWLERAVALFAHITPGGQDQPLIDTDFASFDFDMIAGVEFAVDLSQPARYDRMGHRVRPEVRRIRDLSLRGRPLGATDAVVLATNSYRMGGAGGFARLGRDRVLLAGPALVREVLVDHLSDPMAWQAPRTLTWRFVPMPGTTAVLPSFAHPTAADLAEVAHLRPSRPSGPDGAGYCRFRLHL